MINGNFHWITSSDLPKWLEMNENVPYLDILILAVLGLGLGSLLLDTLVYKHCLLSPVFSGDIKTDEDFPVCYYGCMGCIGCLKSK